MAIFDLSSPDSANWWYVFSWRGLLAAGVVATFATAATVAFLFLQMASSNARDRFADNEKNAANQRIAQLRKLSGPRDIKLDIFKRALEGRPKATVAIWYLPDTSDGFWFAGRLAFALGMAGWTTQGPTPIPEIRIPDDFQTRNLPRAVLAGGQSMGLTVVGDDSTGTSSDPSADTPFDALSNALAKSTDFGVYGASGSEFMPVPTGTLRIVVAAKVDPIFGDEPANVAPTISKPQ